MKKFLVITSMLLSQVVSANQAEELDTDALLKKATQEMVAKVEACFGYTISVGGHFIDESNGTQDSVKKQYLNFFSDCVLKELVKERFNLKEKGMFDK